jgi:membrane-associated phospholipid phosphatase
VVAASNAPGTARAQAVVHPWELLGDDLAEIYGWPNLLFHLSAVAVTPPLVLAADGPVQRYFQRHDPLGDRFGTGALIVGGTLPALLPVGLYFGALAADASELATAGAALMQAEVIQVVVVTALKWLTDRKGPYDNGDPNAGRWSDEFFRDTDDPKAFNFNPFDLRGGMRWPSGHTASSVTLVSCLFAFYPQHPWIAIVGYPAALIVGVGMVEGDYHWLSDIVAGALIGHVIGWVVGRRFRTEYDARRLGRAGSRAAVSGVEWSLLPTPGGLRLGVSF